MSLASYWDRTVLLLSVTSLHAVPTKACGQFRSQRHRGQTPKVILVPISTPKHLLATTVTQHLWLASALTTLPPTSSLTPLQSRGLFAFPWPLITYIPHILPMSSLCFFSLSWFSLTSLVHHCWLLVPPLGPLSSHFWNGRIESGLFHMTLAVFSLVSIIKSFSSTTTWSSHVLIPFSKCLCFPLCWYSFPQ